MLGILHIYKVLTLLQGREMLEAHVWLFCKEQVPW
jgi:hypothetical protein